MRLPKGIEVEAGGSGGKSKTIELIQLDKVIVGNMQVLNVATGVTDFSELFSSNIAGILGSNFFKHFKVTIDYQENKVTLSQDTKPVKLKDNEIRIPFETDMKNGFAPKIECVVDGKIKGTGIIDTGTNGIADLPLAMMKKTSSFEEGAVLTAKGSMSAGMFGVEDESLAIRVKEIQIGDLRVTNIPSMSHAAKNGHVLIGNNFLNKFLVTLNYPADEMILKPNGVPFETNIPSYGLALTKKDEKTMISGVVKNSSAAKKGMVPGYEIVKINSREVRTISLMEILSIFSNEDINSIEIEFIKEKLLKKVTLHKEMLFPIYNKI